MLVVDTFTGNVGRSGGSIMLVPRFRRGRRPGKEASRVGIDGCMTKESSGNGGAFGGLKGSSSGSTEALREMGVA